MPNTGLPKLNKKLRMMEFWDEPLTLFRVGTSNAAGTTTVSWRITRGASSGTTGFGIPDASNYEAYKTLTFYSHLPRVTVALPGWAIMQRVVAMLRFKEIEDTDGALAHIDERPEFTTVLDPNTIRVDDYDATRMTRDKYDDAALTLTEHSFRVAASSRSKGSILIGDKNLKGAVTKNGIYTFYPHGNLFSQGEVTIHEPQFGLRIHFK